MKDLKKMRSILVHSGDGDYEYEEVAGSRRLQGRRLTILVKDRNASQDTDEYNLSFDWSQPDGSLWVRGDFFSEEPSSTSKKAIVVSDTPGQLVYHVYEVGDNDPWIVEIELDSTGDEDEDVVKTTTPVTRLSSRSSPMLAKSLKDKFNDYATAVASCAPEVIDEEDGAARLYIKFLNGRAAVLGHFDEVSEEERGEIFYIHWTDHVSLKKFWTSVSAAIVFSVAFAFTFETEDGDEVELLLRRAPDDEHVADEFCEEILGGMQGELEELLGDELKTTVEQGFARLEKLIVQNQNPPVESPARKSEKFTKPALKRVRRSA